LPEKFDVPFCEPFYCTVDEINNFYFVTESGAIFVVRLPPDNGPRQAKPLLTEPGWRARVLLRDAINGWTAVFAQRRVDGQPDTALMVPLIDHAPTRDLPVTFFSDGSAKSEQALLWKCADTLQAYVANPHQK
jgi:hypothetical protein